MAGPALGTLLIQRLDAALGTTLSQQANIVNRARPDAVTQPGQAERNDPVTNNLVRHPRESVERAASHAPSADRVGARQTARTAHHSPSSASGPVTTTSATTNLGAAARIILNLLANDSLGSLPVAGRAPLVETTPATAQATADIAPRLAQALRQALQHSGLFYESHLRALASGQYRLTDIQQEPQAPLPTTTRADAPGVTTAANTSSGTAPTPGVDPATHGVVRQQLEALADQSVQWRGEAWPGADMQWRIERESPHDTASSGGAQTTRWATRLQLNLPGLGHVVADLKLDGTQLQLALKTDDAAAALLQEQAASLRSQLSARRLQLASISVANHESGEP